MKKFLLSALAVCLLPSFATAASHVFDYYPTKDAGILGCCNETASNSGAGESTRPSKFRQHALLMDFDWGAIAAEILTQAGNGKPLGSAQIRLSEAGSNRLNPYTFNIVSQYIVPGSNGSGDWHEGDGVFDFNSFNFTPGTFAATSFAPSSIFQLDGNGDVDLSTFTDDGDRWKNSDGSAGGFWEFRNFALRNTARFEFPEDDVATTLFIDLDLDILEQQSGIDLNGDSTIVPLPADSVPAGIFTYDFDGPNNGNGQIYAREQAGLDQDPLIRLTFVPEPSSIGLLLLGGIGVLLRRKR